ncbi:hypothetical protein Tco_0941792 [Tanacetum coccineum]|uniref:Uncharacterized protein n=1 Tax=Tanacetum coccineum TaxID=301880 RepID=A0ABQ5DUB3_9ASTR
MFTKNELCPPNKRYALMDANKKIDLEHPLCPNESKILANILQNYPLRFNIAASSSVPWIYLGKFWHTLKEDGSKYMLSFVLDRKELTMTLDDFRTIFQLLQAIDNNHERFVAAPKFSLYLRTPRTTSTPRSPNNELEEWRKKCSQSPTLLLDFVFHKRRLTQLTPPTPIPTTAEVEEMIVQDTIQLSIDE